MKFEDFMKIKNKIGYCDNRFLGINKSGGHYVYIQNVNKNGTCDVNVMTSLEDSRANVNLHKIKHVRKGNTYSIPFYDANFKLWTGVNKKPIRNVKISEIKNIGRKKIKRRHLFFIGKFLK